MATSLAQRMFKAATKPKSVWTGPCDGGPQGGCTQSMLSKFLCCPERFRLYAVEGLRTSDKFSVRMEYGNCWHTCEEAMAAGVGWDEMLRVYATGLIRKYPFQQSDVEHWYMVCARQFPLYVDYWSKHPDVVAREPLMQEQVFDVPYKLPSGRVVRLRGKWDSVDIVKSGENRGIWLMENKSKGGDIDQEQLRRQLTCDLQTVTYLIALKNYQCDDFWQRAREALPGMGRHPRIMGVRYNVVKRPLSGGKGTIKQREPTDGSRCSGCDGFGNRTMYAGTKREKYEPQCSKCEGTGKTGAKPGETKEEFYDRLAKYIEDEPETYFMRWEVEVTDLDLANFQKQVLNPLLERLCDWWEWISTNPSDPFANHVHLKTPFGWYSSVAEGVIGDYDNLLATGSRLGLQTTDNLFRELA